MMRNAHRGAFVSIFVIVCALGVKSTPASAQPKAKPILSEKSRAVAIAVFVDERLRAEPRLYQSILGEARLFVAATRAEAEAAFKRSPADFRLGPWTYERRYDLRAAAGSYLSVTVLHSEFTGGAHPNSRLDAILWNREPGRRTTVAELFRESHDNGPTLRALLLLVREALAAEKRRRGVPVAADPARDPWLEPLKPEWGALGAPTLAPSTIAGKSSGLTFHSSPYAVGPYAEGFYTAYVGWQALVPHLTKEARALFAGARPRNDEAIRW